MPSAGRRRRATSRTLGLSRRVVAFLAALGVFSLALTARAAGSGAAGPGATGGPSEGRSAGPAVSAPALPLTWRAPAGCGSAPEVESRTLELLGDPGLSLGGVEHVEARVSETRDGWALLLIVRDALGTRERQLAAEQCSDLVEAAAIAISLAVEAARAGPSGHGDGATAASDGASSAANTSSTAGDAPPSPASRGDEAGSASAEPALHDDAGGPGLQAGAELLFDLSSLAAAAAGPSLFFALDWGELAVAAQATWLPGADKSVGPDQAVEFSLLAGGLRACYTFGRGILDTGVCAGLDAGRLTARGAGLVDSRIVHDPWLSLQGGLTLSRDVGAGFALQARGDVVAPLLRQGYAVNETEAVYRVAPVGARIALGARASF